MAVENEAGIDCNESSAPSMDIPLTLFDLGEDKLDKREESGIWLSRVL